MSWDKESRTCWNLRTLTAVSGFDAITSSRPIFNATHTSLPIVRRSVATPFEGGVRSTENDLLAEFFNSDNSDGALIIPVIGDRGVGKSHIIRFLFENRPIDPNVHVVYIPKSGTDLRSTIGLIIEGLDDRFNDIKTSLATAQAHNPLPGEAVERLLVELYLKVEKRATQPSPDDDAATTTLLKISADLLDDSVFRQQFSQLGGPRRIVAGPLGEDFDIPDEKRTVFSLEDLPFGQITRDQLAETAREAYTQFSMSITAQKKFLQFINEVLPAALQEVFWSNGPKLTTLLRDVRRLLLEDDREIFLLIEDLVVLSGLQEELLQAFITPAVESPGEPKTLAPLRVAFAITNEPFRAIQDTVISRVRSVYSIDLSQGTNEPSIKEFGKKDQIAFLSKYLNASRYSIEEISEYDRLGQDLPSKCDNCEVSERCLPDFGSHDGIGMYPFTTPALTNLLAARSGESFNPRGAIRGVLAEVLREAYKEIPRNEFPSDQVMDAFKNEQNSVPLEVMNDIELKFHDDTPRRINLQRFWAANKSVRDPWTEWIRISFGLGKDTKRITQSTEIEKPLSEPPRPDPVKPITDAFSYLDVWATGGNVIIPEQPARFLRTVLYELVSGRLEDRYGISISKPIFQVGQSGEFLQRDSFIIAQSGGGGGVGENPKFWTTKIDTSISTALMFKYILQSSATGNHMSPAELSDLYRFIEPMIQGAKEEYDLRYGDLSEELENLRFFARTFGESDDFLDDLLSDQLKLDTKTQGRSAQWVEVIRKWTELRTESLEKILATSGSSKGDGGTLSTRVQVLLTEQISKQTNLANVAQSTANEELLTDKKKLEEISLLLDGQDAKELFSKLRDSLSELGLHLSGQLIPQPQLLELSRRLENLDQNWNSDLLVAVTSGELSPEEIVKSVAKTDTTIFDGFLKDLAEILGSVEGIIIRANQIGTGNSSLNATLLEIQSSISDIQQTLEQLR